MKKILISFALIIFVYHEHIKVIPAIDMYLTESFHTWYLSFNV